MFYIKNEAPIKHVIHNRIKNNFRRNKKYQLTFKCYIELQTVRLGYNKLHCKICISDQVWRSPTNYNLINLVVIYRTLENA